MLTSIKIEHWGPAGQKKDQVVIRFPLVADIKGQKILIVDDITDTGNTLEIAVKYIESFGPSEVKTAVLQHKDVSTHQPDFFIEKIAQWRWVTYLGHYMKTW
jgi:hypoxanthine phosphoribosyltransferase